MNRRALHSWMLLVTLPNALLGVDQLKLKEGDRVVLVGNTLIEREQIHGYWETAWTARYPNQKIIFRNLGWSGDTVFGEARARFGTVAQGFFHLQEHVYELKPTVILVAYGLNESFEGKAGLDKFLRGLDVLLDMLAKTKARIIMLSPSRHEDLGRPLPDPTEQNQNLRLYRDAMGKVAQSRGYAFVDLLQLLGDGTKGKPKNPLTDNGIHLTAYGYWRTGLAIDQGLGVTQNRWRVQIDVMQGSKAVGTKLGKGKSPLQFDLTDDRLPVPPLPAHSPTKALPRAVSRVLKVRGLKSGKYSLRIDGKEVVTATAREWAAGITLPKGAEFDQVEKLRQAILAKNELFFHRWRPQNETYLFGFRKHEQGRNGKEVAQFDPLIAKVEAEIAKLKVPRKHRYELIEVK